MSKKKIYAIIASEVVLLLVLLIAGRGLSGYLPGDSSPDPTGTAASSGNDTQEVSSEPLLTGWQEIDGGRYYYGQDGLPVTGWLELDDAVFYLGNDGKMVTGPVTVDGKLYFFGENGQMHTGWQTVDGATYFFTPTGAATGWHQDGENTYYLDADGKMQTGWLVLEKKHYYLGEDGVLVTGWQTFGTDKYYFREDGRMAIGQLEIDGVNRFFTSTGKYVIMPNPWNPVPEDFVLDLVDIEGYKFDAAGRDALAAMLKGCRNAGHDCGINNTYRSKATQQYLWDNGIKKRMDKGMTYDEALADTKRAVMIPGHSEHQTGLAVDIDADDTADAWLGEHCWEYGFILRYPDDREEITGIKYEPWHFRYVGTELSLELKELGMCMEEYMDMLTRQQAEIA